MIHRIDGFLGRLAFRAIGYATALIALAAGWAAFASATPWQGGKPIVALILFGAGAVMAGWVTRWCFSRERTFGEFLDAAAADDGEIPTPPPRRQAEEAGCSKGR